MLAFTPTAAQSEANAKTATATLARTLGLYANDGGGFRVGDLSRDAQILLSDALAGYVSDHPYLFTDQAVAAARYHLSLPLTGKPLFDESGDALAIGKEIAANFERAGLKLASVGEGVLTTLDAAKWAIPVGVAVVFGVVVWQLSARAKKEISA